MAVGDAVFLIKMDDWKDFMFQNDKFAGSDHPHYLLEYFENQAVDPYNTLQKRQNANGSIKQQPFLSWGSNKLYSLHREKKKSTSMWNALFLYVFVFSHAFNFILETEDNSIPRHLYNSYII